MLPGHGVGPLLDRHRPHPVRRRLPAQNLVGDELPCKAAFALEAYRRNMSLDELGDEIRRDWEKGLSSLAKSLLLAPEWSEVEISRQSDTQFVVLGRQGGKMRTTIVSAQSTATTPTPVVVPVVVATEVDPATTPLTRPSTYLSDRLDRAVQLKLPDALIEMGLPSRARSPDERLSDAHEVESMTHTDIEAAVRHSPVHREAVARTLSHPEDVSEAILQCSHAEASELRSILGQPEEDKISTKPVTLATLKSVGVSGDEPKFLIGRAAKHFLGAVASDAQAAMESLGQGKRQVDHGCERLPSGLVQVPGLSTKLLRASTSLGTYCGTDGGPFALTLTVATSRASLPLSTVPYGPVRHDERATANIMRALERWESKPGSPSEGQQLAEWLFDHAESPRNYGGVRIDFFHSDLWEDRTMSARLEGAEGTTPTHLGSVRLDFNPDRPLCAEMTPTIGRLGVDPTTFLSLRTPLDDSMTTRQRIRVVRTSNALAISLEMPDCASGTVFARLQPIGTSIDVAHLGLHTTLASVSQLRAADSGEILTRARAELMGLKLDQDKEEQPLPAALRDVMGWQGVDLFQYRAPSVGSKKENPVSQEGPWRYSITSSTRKDVAKRCGTSTSPGWSETPGKESPRSHSWKPTTMGLSASGASATTTSAGSSSTARQVPRGSSTTGFPGRA